MTLYAIPNNVPEDCDYLTDGKQYEVFDSDKTGFEIIDDVGTRITCLWSNCYHIKGGFWSREDVDYAAIVERLETEKSELLEALEGSQGLLAVIIKQIEAGSALKPERILRAAETIAARNRAAIAKARGNA